jgi:single-strand DNA-binding protein
MNIIHLAGRLGSDPKPVGNEERPITKISVATDGGYYKKSESKFIPETDWHTVFFFGRDAETIIKCFKKGDGILVSGKLKQNKKVDENGNKKDGFFIYGDSWEFPQGSSKSNNTSVSESDVPQTQAPVAKKSATATKQTPAHQVSATVTATAKATEKKAALEATVTHTDADLSYPELNDDLPF